MSTEEIIRLILSLLGGGVVAGLIAMYSNFRIQNKSKQIEYIRSQLQELYGPLQFFTSYNAKLFELYDKFHKAYENKFIKKQYSNDESTRAVINKSALETIQLANQYIDQVRENNTQIIQILKENYFLIEPADTEIFSQFIVDHTRLKTENDSVNQVEIPFGILEEVGRVSFMRPEFIKSVNDRFHEKKAKMNKLIK